MISLIKCLNSDNKNIFKHQCDLIKNSTDYLLYEGFNGGDGTDKYATFTAYKSLNTYEILKPMAGTGAWDISFDIQFNKTFLRDTQRSGIWLVGNAGTDIYADSSSMVELIGFNRATEDLYCADTVVDGISATVGKWYNVGVKVIKESNISGSVELTITQKDNADNTVTKVIPLNGEMLDNYRKCGIIQTDTAIYLDNVEIKKLIAGDGEFEASIISVKNDQGEVVTFDELKNGQLSIEMKVKNTANRARTAMLLVSYYKDDIFAGVDADSITFRSDKNGIILQPYTFALPTGCNKVKIMIWENGANIMPLCGELVLSHQ